MSNLDEPCGSAAELITGVDQYDLTQYDTEASKEAVRIATNYAALKREETEKWLNRKMRA